MSARAPILSARGLLARAALIAVAYGAMHLAGWRQHTCFLSGTVSDAGSAQWTQLAGIAYLLFHVAFWMLAPVLVIAAALLRVLASRQRNAAGGGAP